MIYLIELITSIGSIASILGVTLQTIDIVKKRIEFSRKKDITEINGIIQSLIFIRNPAKAWKELHMVYSSLHSPFLRLYEMVSDGQGHCKLEDNIAPGTLRQLFEEPTMMSALIEIRKRLEVSTNTLKSIQEHRKASEADYMELSAKGGIYFDLSQHCKTINNALDNALGLHQEFCEYLETIEEYNAKNTWNAESVHFVVANRSLYVDAVDRMLTYSDGAVLALLDIYILIVSEIEKKAR